ncbi:MAG: dihydroorotase [Corynebacterium glucuronolyticum]|nr:dihydroorotase [Corynebacterium glucuronolyticum]MDD7585777.1 dihydroorotase [Mycobacteriaceae bacterium]MDY5834946.1 dihydroorotase [Corynebacterium glucuronolyticum]
MEKKNVNLIITNVRPYGEGEPTDITVEDGTITAIGSAETTDGYDIVDGKGGVLLPGLVDVHVHLREPGRENTETIETGSRAAARGGFTAVMAMANTQPVDDNPIVAEAIYLKGREYGLVDVHPIGSITKGLEGKTLTEFGLMKDSMAHVTMFSDDGKCVANSQLMRRALEYAAGTDVLLAQHCEDPLLTEGASAHEGAVAGRLGLRGWPRAAEESIVARDMLLTRDYGGRLHLCHLSTTASADLVKWGKEQGINVTAEVTPHHLLLTDDLLVNYDGIFKVNPPLREKHDTESLRHALLDGTIDVVATDHAPHAAEDKCVEFQNARPGMLGLETSLAIIAEIFVRSGLADWRFVAKVMSERPAEIVRLADQGRPIVVGEPANLTIIDPDHTWISRGDELASKASNNPYEGMEFHTRVTHTFLRGNLTHSLEEVKESDK